MVFLKHGKTKDVYKLEDGNILLKFKDTVTGGEDGQSDPGGNLVVGTVDGIGTYALKVTSYYFEKLRKIGFPTHYVNADIPSKEMIVKPAKMFGSGLEFVIRYEACGSFVRRYAKYCKEGDKLNGLFEVTLKDDARNDPPATREIILALKLMDAATYDEAERLARQVCDFVRDDLCEKGLELIDIKVEFGMVDGKIALIDEISAGNMRVFKDRKKLSYEELSKLILN